MKRTLAAVVFGIAMAGVGVAWAQTASEGDAAARREAMRACRQQARDANPDADRGTLREAVKSCLAEMGILPRLTDEQKAQAKACLEAARQANPDAGRRMLRAIARPCLEQAGILPPLTEEQQARRDRIVSCLEQARAEHPGDRPAIRQAVRECVRGS